MSLLQLPDELIVSVLRGLDVCSLLRCQAVCCRLQAMISDSVELQYLIVLAATGVCENPYAHLRWSLQERLAMAKEYDAAWRAGTWTALDIPLASVPHMIQYTHISCGVLAVVGLHDRTIYVTRIPSVLRGVRHASWELALDDPIINMQIDASQDLLVYACNSVANGANTTLRLASLTTGGQHPLAQDTSLELNPGFRILPYSIKIYNHVILLYVVQATGPLPERGWLAFWDWKAGECRLVTLQRYQVTPHIRVLSDYIVAFVALTPNRAGPAGSESCIEVYDIRRIYTLPSSSSDGMLHPINFTTSITDFPSFSFALPTLRDGVAFEDVFFAEDSTGHLSTSTDQTSGAFSTDPAERLLNIMVLSSSRSPADLSRMYEKWDLFIPARKLLFYVAEPATEDTATLVPWAVWARDARLKCWGSREQQGPRRQTVSVSGMRKVDVQADRVVISDFHPYRVARGGTQEAADPSTMITGHHISGTEPSHAQGAVTTTLVSAGELGVRSGIIVRASLTDDCLIFTIRGVVSGALTQRTKVLILGRPPSK
ncbi:hypothetical protein FA95DRAFT_491916 [Auriscalpium vulgare]|uniref:Uncharacterized protein n=1 Tax=Auriscalpium vulgare TaxID=40419 RepID=A0ACB8S378_9AGAM|nr:hypothetical protein FA95DRAFT_491916 [Auriscalpium vulgare]